MSYDVGANDIELDVPEVGPDRYWSVAFYTAYGDNYLNIGALNSSLSGKHLLTLEESTVADGSIPIDTSTVGYAGSIFAPHPIGVFLIRTVLKSSEDIEAASNIQKSFTSVIIPRTAPVSGPGLNLELFATPSNVTIQRILTITARFTNTTFGNSSLPVGLSLAGISDGVYRKPDCVNLSEAGSVANQIVLTWPTLSSSTVELSNNWTMVEPNKVGIYGDDYAARAAVGRTGYLALVVEEAIYPEYSANSPPPANESYIVRFSGKPPLSSLGFWSLTMYDEEGYLVENSFDRYSLGDRSNLTFPGGQLVYDSNSTTKLDGPFDILVQSEEPPANWMTNWLPSPPDQPEFSMLLRFYAPDAALQKGTYEYPLIIKTSAATNVSTAPSGAGQVLER